MLKSSLYVRGGKWYGIVYYKDEYGNDKQKWFNTGLKERGNKRQAQKMLEGYIKKFNPLKEEKTIKVNKPTKKPETENNPKDIVFVDWLNKYVQSKKEELTPYVFNSYSYIVKRIKLYFKNTKLKDINTESIVKYYDYLSKETKVKNITIKHYAVVIHPAIKEAYRLGLIDKNYADFVPQIKKEKPEHHFYTEEDMKKLFQYLESNSYELPFKIAAYYGFRRSEIIGLKWDSIDFINKTIKVKHKVIVLNGEVLASDRLKTSASYRTLPLIAEIEKMLLEKQQEIEKNKNWYGNSYNNKYNDYIMVNEIGDLILPDTLTENLQKILKRHNLKYIRLHDLRHSCASLLLANGIQMKQIQEWLGHSNYSTTADIYSHLDYSSKIESAKTIEKTLNFNETKANELDEIQKLEKLLEEKKKNLKQKDNFEM
ncbi:MAG: tyrosine-type recombinase/integrase [Spirochaetales bacterium]